MKKKAVSKFTDEELLSLLDNLDDTEIEPELRFDSSVLAFAATFNIEPGKDRIIKKQLYNLYRVWNKGTQKLSQTQFTAHISNLINHTNGYYYINSDMFQIAKFIETEQKRRKVNKAKSKAWRSHFTAFLDDTKLEAGTVYLETEILYYLYLQWRKLGRKTALLSRKQFIKILDLYFDVTSISAGTHLWVGVNDQIKNLISNKDVVRWRKNRAKDKKRGYYPRKEWKKFALYWEAKSKKQSP